MRSRMIVLLATVGMIVGLLPAAAGGAPPSEQVYLSVGTSLAAGTQADGSGGNTLFTSNSYTDQLYQRMRGRVAPNLTHVKLGCPGETVATMLDGALCGPLYPAGNQLDQAVAVLASGDVAIVTIDLGANDFLQATPAILACGDDQGCIGAILFGIASDVAGVVGALRAAAGPDVPIVAMNYYNPNLAAWEGYFSGVPGQQVPDPGFAILTNALSESGNALLTGFMLGAGATAVVDIAGAYSGDDFGDSDSDGVPNNVEVICALTFMCPDGDARPNIHPTTKGYRVIAKVFWAEVKALGL